MRRLGARALLLALGFGAACSVIVEPPGRVRCDPPGSTTVCGDNAICGVEGDDLGYCVELTCEMGQELCDGLDNDCDGRTDEDLGDRTEVCDARDDDCDGFVDEGLDRDGDGFTTCGTTDCVDPDGRCRLDENNIDCNDTLAEVNPAAPELCDSIDRDCDGFAVPPGEPSGGSVTAPRDALCADVVGRPFCESGLGCIADDCRAPRGERCEAPTICGPEGECVAVDCTPETCDARPGDVFCSSVTGDCEPRKGNGESCVQNDECSSQVCALPEVIGLATAGRICVEPCCSDNDCRLGEFCWDAGTGTRSCIPVGFQPSLHGRPSLGSANAGASCSSDGECRSGLCQSNTCIGACRRPSDCPSGSRCTLIRREDGEVVTACVPGIQAPGSFCGSASSNACIFGDCRCAPLLGCGLCSDRQTCATDADCDGTCEYFLAPDSTDAYAECDSGGAIGACCTSAQCGDGNVCRPSMVAQADGRFWPTLCDVRRP